MKASLILIVAGFFILSAGGCKSDSAHAESAKEIEIRGIYGSPNAFWNKNITLDQLNVNAVFLNWKGINEEMIERAKREGAVVYAEFPTLNGKGYVDKHPEAWAIDKNGNKVQDATWFMGVCPTEPGFRQYRMTELRNLITKYDIGGVWMDYLHWHAQFEDADPILPETCFCENCIRTFESSTGIDVPDLTTAEQADFILSSYDSIWREWRCSVIAGWVRDARMIVKQEKPGALLGVFHCPWDDAEYDGARYRILGLDYDMLKDIADVFSPMVYHGRMEREAAWVKENTDWFCGRLDIKPGLYPKVWPIVQAYDDPHVISEEEFEAVLRYGTGSGSTGIMMFTSNSVGENQAKTETMKRVYSEWIPEE
jgi:hypothetical protein